MLGFIWFIIMGGVIGWLASLMMRRDASMGTIANIVVGIVGSFIGNSVLGKKAAHSRAGAGIFIVNRTGVVLPRLAKTPRANKGGPQLPDFPKRCSVLPEETHVRDAS